ncbi:ECF-type sigma factor [Rubrivivax gelatinosus]|uniref:ECF-type sigma factor n=1 Tax=Rubrivivax gelatinosus TaxID=28068 RepID=UPI001904EB26|nr:ECF-type sigma factor [Rubrivivax gelatinosus]
MNTRAASSLASELQHADAGDGEAAARLFDTLYRELHRVARREVHAHAAGMTLGATTLLHETYLDMAGRELSFPDRARFFAYASRAMRGLIVDRLRARHALKRGGSLQFTEWKTDAVGVPPAGDDGVVDALAALARADAALAELVDLHCFGGLELVEIAARRGVSERTVQRHWEKARLYLRHALGE